MAILYIRCTLLSITVMAHFVQWFGVVNTDSHQNGKVDSQLVNNKKYIRCLVVLTANDSFELKVGARQQSSPVDEVYGPCKTVAVATICAYFNKPITEFNADNFDILQLCKQSTKEQENYSQTRDDAAYQILHIFVFCNHESRLTGDNLIDNYEPVKKFIEQTYIACSARQDLTASFGDRTRMSRVKRSDGVVTTLPAATTGVLLFVVTVVPLILFLTLMYLCCIRCGCRKGGQMLNPAFTEELAEIRVFETSEHTGDQATESQQSQLLNEHKDEITVTAPPGPLSGSGDSGISDPLHSTVS